MTALVVMQAHNFIPHQHNSGIDVGHHHDHGDEEDDHDSPFTDLTHHADFGKIIVKPQTITGPGQPVFNTERFADLFNELISFENLTEYHPPDSDTPLHLIFFTHSLPERAPPAL
ncbi:MAG TPA: hypothetical protein VF144_07325 [Chitinophagaceae bacterium]